MSAEQAMFLSKAVISALKYSSTCPSRSGICDACNTVEALKEEALKTVARLYQDVHNLQLAKTQMNHCHSAVVRTLPTEIVSTIMDICVADSIDMEKYHTLEQAEVMPIPQKLSQVCRAWNQIANSAGNIWTNLIVALSLRTNSKKLGHLRSWIERTRSHPLNVSIYLVQDDYDWDKFNPKHFLALKTLASSCQQWRNVNLNIPYYNMVKFIFGMLGDLPNINQLRLQQPAEWFHDDVSPMIRKPVWVQLPPSPKVVSFTGYGLLHLNAMNIRWHMVSEVHLKEVTPTECLQLLKSAPVLLSLTFEEIGPEYTNPDQGYVAQGIVQHTFIQRFLCSFRDSGIFHHLSFPNLTYLRLQYQTRHTQVHADWFDELDPFFSRSRFPLKHLELSGILYRHDIHCDLSRIAPLIEHLRLKTILIEYTEDEAPDDLLCRLADTFYTDPHASDEENEKAFLPNLTTLEYEVDDMDFPWELVPNIFGSAWTGVSAPRYQRPFRRLKVTDPREIIDLDSEEWSHRLIPADILLQLLTLQLKGAEIIYETATGEDLFQWSIEVAGLFDDRLK